MSTPLQVSHSYRNAFGNGLYLVRLIGSWDPDAGGEALDYWGDISLADVWYRTPANWLAYVGTGSLIGLTQWCRRMVTQMSRWCWTTFRGACLRPGRLL